MCFRKHLLLTSSVNLQRTVKGSRRRLFEELLVLQMDARALKPAQVGQQLLRAHGFRPGHVNRSLLHGDSHQLIHWVDTVILAGQQLLVPGGCIQGEQAAQVLGETVSGKVFAQLI